MKVAYVSKRFSESTLGMIKLANEIVVEYQVQGFKLTLRQLYYQFVARGLMDNKTSEYKRLGSIVNDARLAGKLDWDAIEDRTRNLASNSHWVSGAEIVKSCAEQFLLDKWDNQTYRIEVWIEKEALAGVFEGVCRELDVPYFCCRGYVSQSEMWSAAMRLHRYEDLGQKTIILHFGDHDPSGLDMTRDIRDRMSIFGTWLEVQRLALTMDQIKQYNPPPNPAKETDSRFAGYLQEFGNESWELDALNPKMLADLVRNGVLGFRELKKYSRRVKEEEKARMVLERVADNWKEIERTYGSSRRKA